MHSLAYNLSIVSSVILYVIVVAIGVARALSTSGRFDSVGLLFFALLVVSLPFSHTLSSDASRKSSIVVDTSLRTILFAALGFMIVFVIAMNAAWTATWS